MRVHNVIVAALGVACGLQPNQDFDGATTAPASEATSVGTETGSGQQLSESTTLAGTDSGSGSTTAVTGACTNDGIATGEPGACGNGLLDDMGNLCVYDYRPVVYGEDASGIAAGDFDADGRLDAVLISSGVARIFYGDGTGQFVRTRPVPPSQTATDLGAWLNSAFARDLNGDGADDIVLSYGSLTSGLLDVFMSNGSGELAAPMAYPIGANLVRVAAADFDGDGLVDLATTDNLGNTLIVLYANADGLFEPAPAIAVGPAPESLAVADITGEGAEDVIVVPRGEGGALQAVTNEGGVFMEATAIPVKAPTPVTATPSDFDGDGLTDLFVSTASNGSLVFYGLEEGGFDEDAEWKHLVGAADVAVADFNVDGVLDIVQADGLSGSGVYTWILGTGSREFYVLPQAPNNFPIDLATGDFNGDCVNDVVFANTNASDVGFAVVLSDP